MKIVLIEPNFPKQEASHRNDWVGYEVDDGGTYLTHRVSDLAVPLYVDIKSSTEEGGDHAAFLALGGKRVKITIEIEE